MNLNDNPRAATYCVTNPAVIMVSGGSEDFEMTPANVIYILDGYFKTVASGAGDVKLDGHTLTSKYSALFLACLDADGTVTVTKGAEVKNADVTAGTHGIHWPVPTADTCPIAGMVITNDTSSVFTGGTTQLDDSDITYDVYDISTRPNEPITVLAT